MLPLVGYESGVAESRHGPRSRCMADASKTFLDRARECQLNADRARTAAEKASWEAIHDGWSKLAASADSRGSKNGQETGAPAEMPAGELFLSTNLDGHSCARCGEDNFIDNSS